MLLLPLVREGVTNVMKWGMNPLYMFAKQQALSDLNKAREAYNAQLQRGKESGVSMLRMLRAQVKFTLLFETMTCLCVVAIA